MTGIVVGVDASDGAANALGWAVREANLRESEVTAVLAWDNHDLASAADAESSLDAIIGKVLDLVAAGEVARRVVCDDPARALLDAAMHSDLLVVGARGLGGFAGLLLGSVSQHCLHHATVPTVVVRALHREPVGRIVVGVDGSPASAAALRWAVAEARLRDAALVAVHAYPSLGPGGPFSAARMDPLALHRAARRAVEASISGVDTAGVALVPTVVGGSAAGAIVDAGDDADLVVVGSRGLGTWDRLLLGSVASQVALHARVAVVVVPAACANGTGLPDTPSARSSS